MNYEDKLALIAPLYKSEKWRNVREEVKRRDKYRCCFCNRNNYKDNVRLDCDHIKPAMDIPISEFFNMSNLQTLCQRCHCIKHGKERGLEETFILLNDCTSHFNMLSNRLNRDADKMQNYIKQLGSIAHYKHIIDEEKEHIISLNKKLIQKKKALRWIGFGMIGLILVIICMIWQRIITIHM